MPVGIVYVLSNPAMPGLVKIDKTASEDAKERIAQLYTTGVPFVFTLEFAAKVPNADEVEDALHTAFAPHRVNPRREFFKLDPEQPIAILRLLHVDDVTSELQQVANAPGTDVTPADITVANEYKRRRRPNLNFDEMRIPIGSILQFKDHQTTAVVASPRKVKLNPDGEETSLTALTRSLLQSSHDVAPGPYWSYDGRSIADIYEDTYTEDTDDE